VVAAAKAKAEAATAARRAYLLAAMVSWAPHGRLAFVRRSGGYALDNLLRFVQEGEDAQDPPPWPVIVARGEVADNGDIELLQWSSPFHPRYFSMGLEGVEREKVVAFIREHLAEPGVRLSDILVSLPERYRPLDLAVGIVSPAGGGAYLRLDGTQHRLAGYLAVLPKVGRYAVLSMDNTALERDEANHLPLEYVKARLWGIATDPAPPAWDNGPFTVHWIWADDHWKWCGQPLVPPTEEERQFLLEKWVPFEQLDHPAAVAREEEVQ